MMKGIGKPHEFEALDEAKRRRRSRIRKLEKEGTAKALEVARVLEACRPGSRCETLACNVCVRRFRIKNTKASVGFMNGRPYVRASIIPARQQFFDLSICKLTRVAGSLRRQLARTLGNLIIIGGVDLLLHDNPDPSKAYWQIHFYLLIEGELTDGLKQRVKEAIEGEPTAFVSHMLCQVNPNDYAKVASYATKSYFGKWWPRRRKPGQKGRPGHTPCRLDAKQEAQMAIWASQFRPKDLAVRHNCKLMGSELTQTGRQADKAPRAEAIQFRRSYTPRTVIDRSRVKSSVSEARNPKAKIIDTGRRAKVVFGRLIPERLTLRAQQAVRKF